MKARERFPVDRRQKGMSKAPDDRVCRYIMDLGTLFGHISEVVWNKFLNAFVHHSRSSRSDMFVATEACVRVEKNTLTTDTGVNSLSNSVILNDDRFCKSCGTLTARTLVLTGLTRRAFLLHH